MPAMALTTLFSRIHLSPLKTHSRQPFKSLHQTAFLHVTPKTSTTSTLSPRSNPSPTFHFITTALITDSDTDSDTDEDEDMDTFTSPVLVGYPEHPFVIEGSDDLFVAKEDNESYYLRVDLPGVEKEGVNLWIDKDFLYFEGVEANLEPYYDKESARKYQKRLSLPPGDCKTSEIKAQVKGGVLRVVIPKLKIEEKEGVLKLLVN